ncbi:hypothetical protein Tco_1219982 [Tanacetum coccineum]
MAFSVISISSDSLEESVWTSTARVILFGTIPTTIPSTVPTTDLPVIHADTPDTPPSQDPYEIANSYSLSETSSDSHSDTLSYSSLRRSSSGYAISDSLRDSPTATSAGHLIRDRIRGSKSVTNFEVSSEDGYVPYVPREVGLGVDVEDNYEPYTEPDVDSNIQENSDACIAFANDLRARGMDDRVVVKTAAEEEFESSARGTTEVAIDPRVRPVIDDDVRESIREDVPDHVIANGAIEVTYETLGGLVQRFHDHTIEIPAHRIQVIESVHRDQRHRIVATSQQSTTMLEQIGTSEQDNVRLICILDVERQRVDRL